MTSIRLTRPPRDNRIRSFSSLPTKQSSMNSLSIDSQNNLDETTDVIHITTPKRKNSYVPPWNLFITSTTVSGVAENVKLRESKSDDTVVEHASDFTTNTRTSASESDNSDTFTVAPTMEKPSVTYDSNDNILSRPKIRCLPSHLSEFSRSSSCGEIGKIKKHLASTPLAAAKHPKLASKCPILNFYANFGEINVDDKVLDVQDEEVSGLPDVKPPTRILSPSVLKQERQPSPETPPVEQESPPTSQTQIGTLSFPNNVQKNINADEEGEMEGEEKEEEEDKSFFSRHAGTFRRSVSAAALDNFYHSESFFSSINDEKFYELGNSQPTGIDDPTFLMKQYKKCANQARRTAWGKTDKDFDKIEECHPQNETESGNDDSDRATTKNNVNSSNNFASSRVSTLMEKCSIRYGGIQNMLACERLKKRRFALADPERMIMSQALREKIEKEVEKRKTSVARKVSQFFNVHMGLNREEDLI